MKIDYNTTIELISGRIIDLSEFRGKVLLICNTASRCGWLRVASRSVSSDSIFHEYVKYRLGVNTSLRSCQRFFAAGVRFG